MLTEFENMSRMFDLPAMFRLYVKNQANQNRTWIPNEKEIIILSLSESIIDPTRFVSDSSNLWLLSSMQDFAAYKRGRNEK